MDSSDPSLCKPLLTNRRSSQHQTSSGLAPPPSLNRLAQDLTNHAGPPTLAEQTWTTLGSGSFHPWARVEAGGQSGCGQGDGEALCREGTGASCLNLTVHRSLDSGLKRHFGGNGAVGSLGCQGGGMVEAPHRGSILSRAGREVWGQSPGMEMWEQQEGGVQLQGDDDCTEIAREHGVQAVGVPELPCGQLTAELRT